MKAVKTEEKRLLYKDNNDCSLLLECPHLDDKIPRNECITIHVHYLQLP